jgi:hypothetical protein
MNLGKYVFAQIMEYLPRHDFDLCVAQFQGERYAKVFSCRDQFLAMVFGQLSYRESLRDVVACLSCHKSKTYHLGFRSLATLSTLARANEKRDWRIYRDTAKILMDKAQKLYHNEPSIASDLEGACYVIDSSSIELCLSLFPWAPYVTTKAAVKLHTVMDLRGSIPTFFNMTSGRVNDLNFLDMISFDSGAFYVMDRAYIDFGRLHKIHKAGSFFVTRTRSDVLIERRYSKPVDRSLGVVCDQTIFLSGTLAGGRYPDTLRRIKYKDPETGKVYVFLTNNFNVSALSIALLYKNRWQIELFFKWIKQHLKIKAFWGHSENALKTQICIALCTYLMVAILKKTLGLKQNLYEILQILSVSLFDKSTLVELFSNTEIQIPDDGPQERLPLLDF